MVPQQVQGPKRKDMEKSHHSGKAGGHTAKVQYTVNANGLIVHNTRHSPGRVHDVRVYRMKHPTFPSGLPSRDATGGGMVRIYVDRSYPGAQKMYEGVEVLAPIRRKPGKSHGRRKGIQQGALPDPRLRGARHPQSQDVVDNG